MNKKDNNTWKKIKIYDIPGFFTNVTIRKVLEATDIFTLDDFLRVSSNPKFITYFGSFPLILRDIYATVKLLRCKYLNEDPNIVINDDMFIEEIIKKLGLSFETEYELIRMNRDNDFFKRLSIMPIHEKKSYFRKNSNMTDTSIKEIVYRLQIINDYDNYKKKLEIIRKQEKKNRMKK